MAIRNTDEVDACGIPTLCIDQAALEGAEVEHEVVRAVVFQSHERGKMHLHRVSKIRIAVVVFGMAMAIIFAFTTTSLPSDYIHAQESIDGKKIYANKCASCHGDDGKMTDLGRALGSKDLRSAEVLKLTDDDMRRLISEGKGNMPACKSTLLAEEMSAVIKYVRTLKLDDGSAR